MKTLAVLSRKGGAGKTTIAVHLAVAAAGLEVCPVVLHYRKAYANRIHEGRTAQETDPNGKAAAEIKALLLWLNEKVNLLSKSQITKRTKKQVGA